VIRAKVHRDGPGEWSWALVDEHSDLIRGVVGSWQQAIDDVGLELSSFARDLEREKAAAAVVLRDVRPAWRRFLGL
jgi:hypothetical protein